MTTDDNKYLNLHVEFERLREEHPSSAYTKQINKLLNESLTITDHQGVLCNGFKQLGNYIECFYLCKVNDKVSGI